jgi:hypothetical protein
MKIKISNELQSTELDPIMREPKPNRFRQAADAAKTVGGAIVGGAAATVGALQNLKSKQDIKTL